MYWTSTSSSIDCSLLGHGPATTGHARVDEDVSLPPDHGCRRLVAAVTVRSGSQRLCDVRLKHAALQRRPCALGSVVTREPSLLAHALLLAARLTGVLGFSAGSSDFLCPPDRQRMPCLSW